jgi:hypothetical protein
MTGSSVSAVTAFTAHREWATRPREYFDDARNLHPRRRCIASPCGGSGRTQVVRRICLELSRIRGRAGNNDTGE